MVRRLSLAPIPGPAAHGARLAGGWLWFSQVRVEPHGAAAQVLPTEAAGALFPEAKAALARLAAARAPLCGLTLSAPRLVAARGVAREGAAIVEVEASEAAAPADAAAQAGGARALAASCAAPPVTLARLSADLAARLPRGAAAMLAHGRGGDARARVEALAQALEAAMIAGAPRERLALDPGPVFGPDGAQALLALAPLHASGCAVAADLTSAPDGAALGAGVALALASGAQLLRVDDVAAAASALTLWRAAQASALMTAEA